MKTESKAPATVDQRESRIHGDGPRIAPLAVEELSDELLQIVSRMAQINSVIASREQGALTKVMETNDAEGSAADISADLGELPEIVRTMLRHPDLFARHTEVGLHLLREGALSARDRELAILRIGWLCQAPYEWGEHVFVAKRFGVTSAEIERITEGPDAEGWSELDSAILRATDELHGDAMISDATWDVLSGHYDDRQLIELPIVVGQYQLVAYYQNSLRLRLHNGNFGLKAR
ncbi:carboxymuconolactone decarboxylase family protein [Sphingomonas cavernae]|uniref:Carboxymuconolactone decarboxylase family protein n=1 Tax=Sphingomonas cavernae TaxID=2320861 RepID=A0A418W7L5_9SPHN|nr:carboxymuconolactone decarboxylase family protein [Sphingomonas cavernae]RJF85990.1 carboxymuconolactone decarboxylase family protein [Sphingomonas cavernae]